MPVSAMVTANARPELPRTSLGHPDHVIAKRVADTAALRPRLYWQRIMQAPLLFAMLETGGQLTIRLVLNRYGERVFDEPRRVQPLRIRPADSP
jgi:hypothetical protein